MTIIYDEEAGGLTAEQLARLEEIAKICLEGEEIPRTAPLELSLSLVPAEVIRDINREYREIDAETDVLSFPQFESLDALREGLLVMGAYEDNVPAEGEEPSLEYILDTTSTFGIPDLLLGDVVINLARVKSQAEEYGHSEERELCYLFCHSVLHLLGYDHETEEEKREMRAREETVMEKMGLTR